MQPIDIILIVALGVLFVGIAAYLFLQKKQGKTSCGCSCQGCQGCPSAGACGVKKDTQTEEGGAHV